MRKREKKVRRGPQDYPDDDGRTIVDMNVEGMPWYMKRPDERPEGLENQGARTPMTKEETRADTWAAIKAGLLVALIFGLVFFLFIAFCDCVWFK